MLLIWIYSAEIIKKGTFFTFHEGIVNDLKQLDGSQLKIVLKALQRIEETNGQIGENIGRRKDTNLQQFKKVKLRKHGISIVFKQVNDEIVVTKSFVQEKENEVYKEAFRRLLSQDK